MIKSVLNLTICFKLETENCFLEVDCKVQKGSPKHGYFPAARADQLNAFLNFLSIRG